MSSVLSPSRSRGNLVIPQLEWKYFPPPNFVMFTFTLVESIISPEGALGKGWVGSGSDTISGSFAFWQEKMDSKHPKNRSNETVRICALIKRQNNLMSIGFNENIAQKLFRSAALMPL